MVITLDKRKQPLGVCTERRARILLAQKRACVYKYYPFTIIIKNADVRKINNIDTYRVKIDPGATHTGIAVIRNSDNAVVYFQQIKHRGLQVKMNLQTRNQTRRNRRSRETRYRRPKFGNKQLAKNKKPMYDTSRPEGWLPPSIKSVADNVIAWVHRLKKLFNITECSFEAVRFDTQLLDNPNIEGMEYQHGELMGYEMKEYLLRKYGHICQYCGGESNDSILEWEHMLPRSRGGSDSVKNATLACHSCNQEKGKMTPAEWLGSLNEENKLTEARRIGIQKVIENKSNSVSDRYCAWVTASRRYIERHLFSIFGFVECASGGRTKYNRTKLGLPKDHHYDALCVGTVPDDGYKDLTNGYCLMVTAKGRGTRLRGLINKCGIIKTKFRNRHKEIKGFRTGDLVRAVFPEKSKHHGTYVSRVATRESGYFSINTIIDKKSAWIATSYENCKILQRDDGYGYKYQNTQIAK